MAGAPVTSCPPDRGPAARYKAEFGYHFATTLLVNTVVCTGTLLLWSSCFYGPQAFAFLADNAGLSLALLAACSLIIFALYMLDFFWPPHHGEVFVLWAGDHVVGRSFLGAALVIFLASCYFRTDDFVSLPLLISICMCPLAVFGLHVIYDPFKPPEMKCRKSDILRRGGIEEKMRLLKRITGEEVNEMMFYAACVITFLLWGVANLLVFALLTCQGPSLREMTVGLSETARDAVNVQWAAPLVMSVANFVYSLFSVMRVVVQQTYSGTDACKNRLIADLGDSTAIREMTEHITLLVLLNMSGNEEQHSKRRQEYLHQHTQMVNQLSTILKGVICSFIVLLGLCYCARQMLYASTEIASLVAGTMAVFFLIFCIFAYVSLHRVVKAMGKWMVELPAWQSFSGVLQNPWIKACAVCTFTPLIPGILLLSLLNQRVRCWRGIYSLAKATTSKEKSVSFGDLANQEVVSASGSIDPETRWLTPRIGSKLLMFRKLDWLEILPKIYTLCLCYFAYTVFPPPLNVALAAMNKAIEQANIHYVLILLLIFITGIICFLCPTVPGAVMYMFGGLISSAHCPWGFWPGAVIGIVLGLVMKLAGSAVQQEGLGGLMGRSLSIRRAAGVHKPAVRCIEHVLREKGFTAGKVAILCGGPDWPTSVLAGILRLPLLEMEIGTLPIIGFIAPFGLSGSLRLRAGQDKVMENCAQLMLVSAFLVTLVLWALAGWACQQALEKSRNELTRPLAQNADLEWLDYKEQFIKDQLRLSWSDVPACVRVSWVMGALVQILVCYSFCFGSKYLVGEFQLNDDISTLHVVAWKVEGSLFSWWCVIIVLLYVFSWLGHLHYSSWRRRKTRVPLRAVLKEVAAMEASWKEDYLTRCANWTPPRPSQIEEPKEQGGGGNLEGGERSLRRMNSKASNQSSSNLPSRLLGYWTRADSSLSLGDDEDHLEDAEKGPPEKCPEPEKPPLQCPEPEKPPLQCPEPEKPQLPPPDPEKPAMAASPSSSSWTPSWSTGSGGEELANLDWTPPPDPPPPPRCSVGDAEGALPLRRGLYDWAYAQAG